MKKSSKTFWTMLVLAIGMAMGFGATSLSSQSSKGWPTCSRDSDCDNYCGEVGAGVCVAWTCYCIK